MAKRFSVRNVLAGVILLLALLLVIYTAERLPVGPTQQVADLAQPDADLAMQSIHYTETRNGERVWSLQADSAEHDLESGRARVKAIRMTVYDRHNGDIRITARRGELDLEKRRVRLLDDVVVKTVAGQTLYADDLIFTDADRAVTTDGPVTFVGPDYRIVGVGLRYEVDTRQLKLHKQVEARFSGRLTVP